jgi:hypothetical protein
MLPLVSNLSRTTEWRRSYSYLYSLTKVQTVVNNLTINLRNILGTQATTVSSWWDEYVIRRLTLRLIYASPNVAAVHCMPDINAVVPTDAEELRRSAGARSGPVDFSRGAIVLASTDATYDVTAGGDQFIMSTRTPGIWQTTNNDGLNVTWRGFNVSWTSIKEDDTEPGTLGLEFVSMVAFRGAQ